MAPTTTNLIQGSADLYSALFGATEPATTAFGTAPAGFADCGSTKGGVTWTVNQTYTEMEVDQLVDVPERRMTKREFSIGTTLAEATLGNLALALNNTLTAPVSSGSGATANQTVGAASVRPGDVPAYIALIMDSKAPNNKVARFIGRKMLNTKAIALTASKSDQTVLEVEFAGHWVSPSIRPFDITYAS